ncbi:MAG: protein kinase domain-containing protein [Planctomycetota bacterium]|jgi:serine/threonine protein kinase
MSVCLSQKLAERYKDGDCSGKEKKEIEAHLIECEGCRRQIEVTRTNISKIDKSNPARIHKKSLENYNRGKDVVQDEYPTKAISQEIASSRGNQDFVKSLESMIEGYEILEEMPRGGQAVVYKAIHTATKTKVAIKVLLPTLLASARARYYFEREAELIASLDHPNIVGIRDSGIIHHQYYFVMQYIDGQPLERYVRLEKLSFREKVVLFNKICTSITYAHQQGVIHRDLKFANILVDKRGEPHILDFGLAKAVGLSEETSDNAVTMVTGQWAGSLSTMSPEQAAGRPDLIDVRTDIYSLGVILYRLLTGQSPYDVRGSTLEVLKNIQQAEPVRPRQIIRKFDSDVEAILLAALEKDPAQRYQSTAELQSDIEHWLDGRPIRVKSISTMYLLRKIIIRHRYTSAVAALLILIILSFAYTSFYLYIETKKAQQETEAYEKDLTVQTANTKELSRLFVFNFFLEAWRQNLNTQAAIVLGFMSKGSKEKKAAEFLFNSRPVAEKETDFRQNFSDENIWFTEFIIGENYLKNGNLNQAIEAYRRSYATIPQSSQARILSVDALLIKKVKNRLKELNAFDKSAEENGKLKTGN